jgi:hypothetical protein
MYVAGRYSNERKLLPERELNACLGKYIQENEV